MRTLCVFVFFVVNAFAFGSSPMASHDLSLATDGAIQPIGELHAVVYGLSPQRHRAHRGRTEKNFGKFYCAIKIFLLWMSAKDAGCTRWFTTFTTKAQSHKDAQRKKQKNADHDMLVRLCAYFVRLCVLCGECVSTRPDQEDVNRIEPI